MNILMTISDTPLGFTKKVKTKRQEEKGKQEQDGIPDH